MNHIVSSLKWAEMLEEMLLDSGGEITPEIQLFLSAKDITTAQIVDSRYMSLERIQKTQELFKQKAEQFSKLAKSLENAHNFINSSIKQYMRESGKEPLVGTEYQFKLSNSKPKVNITNEATLPKKYKKVKKEIVIDKEKISEDLQNGVKIEGCVLEEVYALRKSIRR